MATTFEKYGCAALGALLIIGMTAAAFEDAPNPEYISARADSSTVAPSIDRKAPQEVNTSPEQQAKLRKSLEKKFAVTIILNGYGCSRLQTFSRDTIDGKTMVTCVERKGRTGLAQYLIDEDSNDVTPL